MKITDSKLLYFYDVYFDFIHPESLVDQNRQAHWKQSLAAEDPQTCKFLARLTQFWAENMFLTQDRFENWI